MESNRRSFLKGAAITAAPLFIPRGAFGANDRIAYGVIADQMLGILAAALTAALIAPLALALRPALSSSTTKRGIYGA